jgi:hypothetical protein
MPQGTYTQIKADSRSQLQLPRLTALAAVLCCVIRLYSLPLLLLLVSLQLAAAQHKDPSPHIIVENLPMVCPSGRSGVQVQDVTDSTSYYVCCGASTPVVRKTCR